MKKYYYAGTQRIAMRKNNVLSYIIGDHLGSTSIVTDASGNVIAQQKYKAWGEVRYESGTNPSEYSYTGQYSYTDDFGLMFYNACWYDSSLSRFAQADTIVPSGSQGLDRYAYVNNSPVMYTDPSGHDAWWCEGNDSCLYNWLDDNTKGDNEELLFEKYNVTVDENMPSEAKRTIMQGIYIAGTRFSETIGGTAAEAFRAVYGLNDGDSFRFEFVQSTCAINGYTCWGYTPSSNRIQIYQSYTGIWAGNEYTASTPFSTGLILHELGHAFNQRLGGVPMAGLSGDLLRRTGENGFFANHYVGQYSYDTSQSEIFADMFLGWSVGRWGNNLLGDNRSDYMENMTIWVLSASNLP